MSLPPCFFVVFLCTPSSLKDLAYLSGGMFPIRALLAWGKMRSRCWIHMLGLSPLSGTKTHCPEYVQKWVGANRVREEQTQTCVCVCAKTRECGRLNALENLFKGTLTNK